MERKGKECERDAKGMEWNGNGSEWKGMERNGIETSHTSPTTTLPTTTTTKYTRLLERLKRGYPTLAEHHIRPQTLRVPLLGQDIRRRLSYDSRLRASLLRAITTIITIVIAIAVNTRRRLFGRNCSSCKKQRTGAEC